MINHSTLTTLWRKAVAASLVLLSGVCLPAWAQPAKSAADKPAVATAVKTTAATSAKALKKVTSVEGITEYQLSNGLRVLLFPDPSKSTITVNVTYLVGSKHEGYGETGMAHLLEHLVFKGSPRHKNIPQELTAHGARPNGTTWYDRTNYFETFSATDENLKWALDLESDRMVNSFIAKKDLESEMTVVRNEFEMGENYPSNILMQRILSTAYLWHNYGKSTIGSRADLEHVPIDRLQAFYKKHYQPDNAVLVVAGKIDEDKVIKLVNQYFGVIPRPVRKLTPTYSVEPAQDGERFVNLRRVGDVQVVSCAYHTPPGSHPDFAAMDVLTEMLTNEPAGRLYKALVENKKASYMYGWNAGLKDPGFVYFSAELRQESSLDEAKNAMTSTLDAVVSQPPTAEEVDRAKNKLLKDFELNYTNSERVGLELSEFIAQGDWRLAFIYRDRVKKVTPEDVLRVAKDYLKPSNRTMGTFVPDAKPDRAEIPAAPDVAELVKDYKGEEAIAAGEAFDPAPANIEARTHRGQESDAIKYAFLPKKTRGATVVARLTLRYGDEQSLLHKGMIARFTAMMLDKGTQSKTRQQIQDELDKLKARVNVYGWGDQANVNIETKKENLPAVMKLVGEMLKQPAFSETEFEKLRQEQLTFVEDRRNDPQAIAFNMHSRNMSPYTKGDVRYQMTFEEEIEALKALKLDELKQFYKDFYGASNTTLSVVGDFDEAEIKKITTDELAAWKSPKPYSRLVNIYKDIPSVNQSYNTPDKSNATFIAGINIPLREDDPDYPALVLGNYMLGGGFLNSRLATRIRQKDGLSYGVGSWLSAGAQDKAGSFTAYAIYNPDNASKLEAAFKEEIEKAWKEGFTAQEIAEAKTGYLQSRQVNRAQDASLAGTLNYYLFLNRDLKWDEEFEKRVAGLTSQQISDALRKHIDPSKLCFVKAGDFEKAKKKAEEGSKAASGNKAGGQ